MKKEDLFDTFGDINSQYIKEAHMKSKRKNNFAWAKWGALAACFVLLLVSIPMLNRLSPVEDDNTSTVESSSIGHSNKVETLQNGKEESANMQEEQVKGEELQIRIDELMLSDSLGWIVYEDRIYIQDLNLDTASLESNQNNTELSECLGRASDYIGAYRNSDACDGDVYTVENNPDILCLKLDNGATIWLRVEETEILQGEENATTEIQN